jgi:hypothetical protein
MDDIFQRCKRTVIGGVLGRSGHGWKITPLQTLFFKKNKIKIRIRIRNKILVYLFF